MGSVVSVSASDPWSCSVCLYGHPEPMQDAARLVVCVDVTFGTSQLEPEAAHLRVNQHRCKRLYFPKLKPK